MNQLAVYCFVIFNIVNSSFALYESPANKLCTDFSNPDACAQIVRDQDIECNIVKSNTDCIINADLNLPHLSAITAEEALTAAPLVSKNVVVIGEVNGKHRPYETAVVVRNTFSGNFLDLKGYRYCHPGFRHDEFVSKYVLEELESKILQKNNCSENGTLVEKKIRELAEFFGPSCRPGLWTQSLELDNKLKSTYPSLCELCGGSKCNVDYKEPFSDSLNCLRDQGGDVALTTKNAAQLFFNSTGTANFRYLCPNGTLSNPSNPCIWTKQIPKMLVTSRNNAPNMLDYIEKNLRSKVYTAQTLGLGPDLKEKYLSSLLRLERDDAINMTLQPLKSYVEGFRKIPEEDAYCDLKIRWSTKNDTEQQKCLWTKQAAINSALQPTIDCVQIKVADDVISQLNAVQTNDADMTYIDASFGYISRKKGLVSIAYPETDYSQLTQVLVLVRGNMTESINSLKDLKGKKACFPEYAGKEWLTFIDILRKQKSVEDSCDYDKMFADFVGSSCVPGARDKEYALPYSTVEKLCNCLPVNNILSPQYCNADSGNKYYGSDGALRCLRDDGGFYAVISKNDLSEKYNQNDLKILSKNGSLTSYTGSEDDNAFLDMFIAGEVVMKKDSPKLDDATVLLTDIEYYFGAKLKKPFKVFESFNGTLDLLLPDSAPGLTFPGTDNKYVENFVNLLKSSEDCIHETGAAQSVIVPTILCVVLYLSTQIF